MQKLVADASAVLSVVLDEPLASDVRRSSQDTELVAPGSLSWEVGNALVLGMRDGRLSLRQAVLAFQQYTNIPIREISIDPSDALEIADAEGIYAYDAYMLAGAHRHAAPLLTLDLQLRSIARNRGLSVRPKQIEGDERYD